MFDNIIITHTNHPTSHVPYGFVLRPLLFFFFTFNNDVSAAIQKPCLTIYADA